MHRKVLWLSALAVLAIFAWAASGADSVTDARERAKPRPFRVYRSLEAYDDVELPADFEVGA